MKVFTLGIILSFLTLTVKSQNQPGVDLFWNTLQKHCGKAYQGTILEKPEGNTFKDKVLTMHVRYCSDSVIRIPFMVGDDRSRTWVLTKKADRIQLKHDHRHEDGSEDSVSQYGGITTHEGQAGLQIFPADAYTVKMLPTAAANVWWISVDEQTFTYNLRRVNSERLITVTFDLSKEVNPPPAPWGSQH